MTNGLDEHRLYKDDAYLCGYEKGQDDCAKQLKEWCKDLDWDNKKEVVELVCGLNILVNQWKTTQQTDQ